MASSKSNHLDLLYSNSGKWNQTQREDCHANPLYKCNLLRQLLLRVDGVAVADEHEALVVVDAEL